jgi:hypothetical protein
MAQALLGLGAAELLGRVTLEELQLLVAQSTQALVAVEQAQLVVTTTPLPIVEAMAVTVRRHQLQAPL